MGFKYSVSLLPAIQATGSLALTLARLTLAEHASLGWTHDHTCNFSGFGNNCGWVHLASGYPYRDLLAGLLQNLRASPG